MEQFSLEKYLENPSRKIVTRRGNPVRILCTDRKHGEDELPVVFLEENNGGEFLLTCRNDGRSDTYDTPYDLFFADEEEELTEFEKKLQIIISEASHWTSDDGSMSTYCHFGDKEIKKISGKILDLARKEIEKDIYDNGYRMGYGIGKQDALKSLPKWKKITNETDLSLTLSNGKYYLPLEDLETLPKEE